MNKKTARILVTIVTAVLVIYIGVDFFLGSIVKAGFNRFAPMITHTKVELKGAHISPVSGNGVLTGLFVGNPPGWSSDKAFYMGRIHVEVSPFSLFGDHIIVKDIDIDQPEFVYETKIVSSNIGDLLKLVGGAGDDGKATTTGGKPIRFEVKHFRMTHGSVTLGVGAAAITLPMPPIELTDLGTREGGITSNELALAIMRSMTSSVVRATTQAAGRIGSTMGAAAGSAIKDGGNSLKSLFGGGKN